MFHVTHELSLGENDHILGHKSIKYGKFYLLYIQKKDVQGHRPKGWTNMLSPEGVRLRELNNHTVKQ